MDEIIEALRSAGAMVQLYQPFVKTNILVVGYKRRNYLLLVMAPGEEPNQQILDDWPGQLTVVRSVEEALGTIGAEVYKIDG